MFDLQRLQDKVWDFEVEVVQLWVDKQADHERSFEVKESKNMASLKLWDNYRDVCSEKESLVGDVKRLREEKDVAIVTLANLVARLKVS